MRSFIALSALGLTLLQGAPLAQAERSPYEARTNGRESALASDPELSTRVTSATVPGSSNHGLVPSSLRCEYLTEP